MMVVLSAYLRLLIFLMEILILACTSSNPVFHVTLRRFPKLKEKLQQDGRSGKITFRIKSHTLSARDT